MNINDTCQIKSNQLKSCQIMSNYHVKHVKCNVEIRRTYVFKGWICLRFLLFSLRFSIASCSLYSYSASCPNTVSCLRTVIFIACFLCSPNGLLQLVPRKKKNLATVLGSIFLISWLQINCFKSSISLLIAMFPFVARLCVILVLI